MNKYLVISYDPDQQQWFYDVVFAADKDAAKQRLLALRYYSIDGDVFDMAELSRMNDKVQAEIMADSEMWLNELEAEKDGETI